MNIDKEVEERIKKLKPEDWDKLFALIPQIESTSEFSSGGDLIEDINHPDTYIITPEIQAPIVDEFLTIMESIDLFIPYPWVTSWDEGQRIMEECKYDQLDLASYIKLLNTFIRLDHLSYGCALAQKFAEGAVLKVLKEIKRNINIPNFKISTYEYRKNKPVKS